MLPNEYQKQQRVIGAQTGELAVLKQDRAAQAAEIAELKQDRTRQAAEIADLRTVSAREIADLRRAVDVLLARTVTNDRLVAAR